MGRPNLDDVRDWVAGFWNLTSRELERAVTPVRTAKQACLKRAINGPIDTPEATDELETSLGNRVQTKSLRSKYLICGLLRTEALVMEFLSKI